MPAAAQNANCIVYTHGTQTAEMLSLVESYEEAKCAHGT